MVSIVPFNFPMMGTSSDSMMEKLFDFNFEKKERPLSDMHGAFVFYGLQSLAGQVRV